MQKILVAHDGSKSSDKALKKAIELTTNFNASLTILAVVPELYLTELADVDRNRIPIRLPVRQTIQWKRSGSRSPANP